MLLEGRARVMAIRTAEAVAFYRALETLERSREPLFVDPYARLFLPTGLALRLRLSGLPLAHRVITRSLGGDARGMRQVAAARTRFIDDIVRRRVAEGATVAVIIGAGFDCRAHRLRELGAASVFEIDREDVLVEKQKVLRRAPLPVNLNVRYVPVDLVRDDIGDRLAAAGLDRSARTLFVCEGVASYLPESTVLRLLSWIGESQPGSAVVFSYVDRRFLEGTLVFPRSESILRRIRDTSEPWVSGFVPDELGATLARSGLVLVEDLGADEYASGHLGPFPDMSRYSFLRLAVGEVR